MVKMTGSLFTIIYTIKSLTYCNILEYILIHNNHYNMEQGNGSKEQRSYKNMRLSHHDVKSLLQLQVVNSLQPSSRQQPLQGQHPSALIPFDVDRKFVLLSRNDSRVSSASQRLSCPYRTIFYDVLDHKYIASSTALAYQLTCRLFLCQETCHSVGKRELGSMWEGPPNHQPWTAFGAQVSPTLNPEPYRSESKKTNLPAIPQLPCLFRV